MDYFIIYFKGEKVECESRGMELNFIYFTNLKSQDSFEKYVQTKQNTFWEIEPTYFAKEANEKLKKHTEMEDVVNLENVNRIYQMWKKWYTHNNG